MDSQQSDTYKELSDDRFRQQLLELLNNRGNYLSGIEAGVALDSCLLDKIARIQCMVADESHKQAQQITAIGEAINTLLELHKSVHPEAALQLEKFERLRAEVEKCCPPAQKLDLICHYEPCEPHGGIRRGDGYSAKSRGFGNAVQVSEDPHASWTIQAGTLNDNEDLPQVRQGPLVGQWVPVAATPHLLDFRSGGGMTPSGQAAVISAYRRFNMALTRCRTHKVHFRMVASIPAGGKSEPLGAYHYPGKIWAGGPLCQRSCRPDRNGSSGRDGRQAWLDTVNKN